MRRARMGKLLLALLFRADTQFNGRSVALVDDGRMTAPASPLNPGLFGEIMRRQPVPGDHDREAAGDNGNQFYKTHGLNLVQRTRACKDRRLGKRSA